MSSSLTPNPMTALGTLNRTRTSLTFANHPRLNITSSNMGKSQAKLSFNGTFVDQIHTAVGIVNSPSPYVMATVAVSLLRTQGLASQWLTQLQAGAVLGSMTAYGDCNVFPDLNIANVSFIGADPAAYDGQDPTIALTLSGTFFINNSLWTGGDPTPGAQFNVTFGVNA